MIHPSVKFGHYCIVDGVKYEDFRGFKVKESTTTIGQGTIIGNFVEIKAGVTIGENQSILSYSIVDHTWKDK